MNTIFLHFKTPVSKFTGKLNIILSPQLYWVRYFELPLNSTKEVLEILPNLFDEYILENDLSYYTVKQKDGRFVAFAYNKTKILEYLKKASISVEQISNIYFAQIEFKKFIEQSSLTCIKVDSVCLSYIDELLVQIPVCFDKNINNSIDIQSLQLSKHTINLTNQSKYFTKELVYKLSLIFFILIILNVSKIVSLEFKKSSLPMKIDTIKTKYNMPNSLIQTKSIIKAMDKQDKKQRRIREIFGYLLDISQQIQTNILQISVKSNNITVSFQNKNIVKIKKIIQKRYKMKNIINKRTSITIEIEL